MRIMLMLLTTASLFAQIPAEEKTEGSLNCRFWNGKSDSGNFKLGFVMGYAEGWRSTEHDLKTMKKANFVPVNATYGEMIKGVDAICSVPENAHIPVMAVFSLFALKLQGVSEAELTALTEKMRAVTPRLSSCPVIRQSAMLAGGKGLKTKEQRR